MKILLMVLTQFLLVGLAVAEESGKCHPVQFNELVGAWYSNEFIEERGYNQVTQVERRGDGTMSIEFIAQGSDGSEYVVTEELEWGVEGCLYFAITTERNGKPYFALESYTVLEFDASHMRYRHGKSGIVYDLFRSN